MAFSFLRTRLAALALPFVLAAGESLQGPASTEAVPGQRVLVVGLPHPTLARGMLGYDEAGRIDGFARRLLELVGERAGLALEFRTIPHGTGEQELLAGEVDLVCPLSINERRITELLFTAPILIANGAVFVRSGVLPPSSLEELAQRRIVVAAAGIAHQFCVEKGLPFELASTLREALERVVEGRADCVITPQMAGRFELERTGLKGLSDQPLDEDRLRQAFALALRSTDSELVTRLNFRLAEARETGEWERLYERWVAPYQPHAHPGSYATAIIAILLMACGVALAVLIVLRARLTSRTRVLDQTEGLYRVVAESLPALVFSVFEGDRGERELRFVTANLSDWRARFPRLDLEADPRLMLGEVHPDDRPRYEEGILRSREGGGRFDAEFRLRAADGRHRWLHSTASPLRIAGGTLWQSLLLDTTPVHESQEERHRLELQLIQAQRFEGLGLMAGGIAHDFNNFLMEVQGNVELALAATRETERRRHLERALEGTRRAAARTQQLLASAGEARLVEEDLDLGDLVRELAEGHAARHLGRYVLELEPAEPHPVVQADPALMTQVVTQILDNAADAIPAERSGRIAVHLCVRDCTPAELREYMPVRSPGTFVELEVRDDGTGMDEAVLGRVFDPFFSTKFLGRGLGLSVVLSTVERHGGAVRARSVPGRGTSISILLPRTPRAEPVLEAEPSACGAGGTVLVVDDDEPVLEVACSLLRGRGWGTLAALDAEAALARLRQSLPALVLLDLSMPGTSGVELLRRIRAEWPGLPVVLMSGYSESEASVEGAHADAFVSKPFSGDQLVAALGQALASRAAVTASP